ncbi:hypothetical protein BH23CHL2_BH23CHL2_03570 [soil metagenome]
MQPRRFRNDNQPLVGRDRERGRLRELLEGAVAGRGSLVLISGEAGIGKTAMVRMLATDAAQHRLLFLTGHCYELSTPPAYGPWNDLAGDHMENDDLPQATALLDRVMAANVESQAALFREIRDLLAAIVARNPAVLVLEDLHWSDTASLELLRYVARSTDKLPLLLVATYRIDELKPDHALFQLLPSLVRETRATRIALQRLDDATVRSLVAAQYRLLPADEHRLVTYLVDHTEGNPLYLQELLRTLTEEGILARNNECWMLGDLDRIIVPPLIHQLIEGRLARLGDDTRDLLTVAAVIGQDVPLNLWREISDAPDSLLDRVIGLALAAHILQESPEGSGYRFSHALIKEALYSSLILPRRREWHRRSGEVLAQSMQPDPETVAHHFQQAEDPREARWQIQAGKKAQTLHAPDSAIEHFTRALEIPGGLSIAEQIGAYRGRGRSHDTAGDYLSAKEDHAAALEMARETGDRRSEWRALLDLGLVWASRDYERAGACWKQALDLARNMNDPAILAHSLNWVGNWHGNIERPFEAQRYHEEALSNFQEVGDRRGIAETRDFLGMAAMLSGDLIASAGHYRQAIILLEEIGNRQLLSSSWVNLQADTAAAMNMSSRPALTLPDGQQAAERALQIARDIGWRSGEAFALIHLGSNLSAQGHFGEAQQALLTGLGIAEEITHHQWTAIGYWTLGSSHLDLFAYAEARDCLERSLALAKHIGSLFMARCASCFLALAYIGQGALDDAEQLLATELDHTSDPPTVAQRMQWSAYAELALARDRPKEALKIVDWLNRVAPHHPGGYVPINLMLLRGRALTGLRRLQEAEAELQRARVGAINQGAGSWLHAIHLAFIRLYHAQVRPRDAARELIAAQANIRDRAATIWDETLREHYLQHTTSQLAQLADQPALNLSRREIQVLRLVADGLTDAEIGEQLQISPRTVGAHLTTIYNKLDVSGRTAATRVAIEAGII